MKRCFLFLQLSFISFFAAAQLTADFTLSPSFGCAVPTTVFFTDQSTQPDTWFWNFGDGGTSTSQNPIHSYTSAGVYTVSLTVTDTIFGTTDTKTVTLPIEVVNANFSASGTFGCGPVTTNFSATTTGASSYLWNFGDGDTSTQQSPTHIYNNPGAYTVSLTVTSSLGCTKTETKTSYVQVIGPKVNFGPAFTAPSSPPLTVNFTDSSQSGSPIIQRNWSFGDGNGSTNINPSHTYNTVDTFDVSLTVMDLDGCSRTFTRSDLVVTKPLIPSLTVDSNVSCNGFSDGGITASCINGTLPYSYSWSNGKTTSSITGLSAGDYKVTISDANGSTTTDSISISQPAPLASSTTIDSNVSCYSLSNGGATASATGGTSPYTYLWSNSATSASLTGVSEGTYTVTITDNNGCTTSQTAVITEPTALVASTLVNDHVSCSGLSDGNASANAAGGTIPYTYSWSNSVVTALNIGVPTGNYMVTITDANGCTATGSTTIVVLDTIKPTVATHNITVYLDASGTISTTAASIDNGSADACGAPTLSLSKNLFTCAEVGANSIQLIATDVNGNIDSASATVMVMDTIKPSVFTQNVTIYLDPTGTTNISIVDIDNGSTDICGTLNLSLSQSSFSCAEVGANTIQLIATDVNANIDSASAIVTVMDTIRPTMQAQNITLYLDAAGTANTTVSAVDNGSSDVCGLSNLSLSKSSFSCAEVGANTVELIGMDPNGNIDSLSAVVTIVDTIKPSVIAQNLTVYLDALGTANITAAAIDNGSTDACGAPIINLSKNYFTCAKVGANSIQLIATDVNGNIDSATATVTVMDTVKPSVFTQNVTIYLDVTGTANISAVDIDNGSSDICGTLNLSLSQSSFTCAEVGANTIQLIATDVNANIDSASAIVTVMDTIRPTMQAQNVTVYLDAAGTANTTASAVDNGSSDICGLSNLSLSKSTFSCAEVGANTIRLIGTDQNGNMDSISAIVSVIDSIKPNITAQNTTVYLDTSGNATVTVANIDNGSTDICGSLSLSLDRSSFGCSELGNNTVTLKGTDINGNTDSATALVSVVDTIKPIINGCPANIIQNVDAGNCSAIVSWAIPTASDNCNIDSLVTSHDPNTSFSIGTTTVIYIAYDGSMNTDTCSFSITIIDNEKPMILNLPSDTVLNNEIGTCSATYSWPTVTANDNCQLDSLVSSHLSGEMFSVGTTTVTFTAYDNALNSFSASFTVTVNDTEKPQIVCPSNIRQCDSIVNWISPIGVDNCIGHITNRNDGTNLFSGDKFPKGITTIAYKVSDASNNENTCTFDVEIFVPPTVDAGMDLTTRDIEPVQLNATVSNATSISWTPFMNLSDPTIEKPLANPQQTTLYTLQVVSPDGCMASDGMTVFVDDVTKLEATTLFTPNGDGRNDYWVVNKPELIATCQLVIFNRNGTEVYSTNNYMNEWDGTIGGEELPEGTYYYVITCKDNRQYNGPITLLREKK